MKSSKRSSGPEKPVAAGVPAAANAEARMVRKVLSALTRAAGPVRPWRREDPVACLIGTILAQATTDALANRAYCALRARFPSWARVLAAPRAEVEAAIRTCGLSRQKARGIQSFLRHLKRTRGKLTLEDLRRPHLDVDRAIEDLCRADGVGVKTAAITLMFGCGADLCAVDTHLVRILRRLRIVPEKASPERAFRILRPLVPPGRGIELHLQLIRFGRTVCRAQRPRCGECPLRKMCPLGSAILPLESRPAASPRDAGK
jgi:endonuclease-3